MADKKISALTAASTPLAGTESLPIVQSGATVKATVANIVGAGTSPGSFTTLSANGDATVTSSIATTLNLNLTNTKAAGQGDAYFNITKAANGNSNGIQLLTGANQKWVVGTGITAVNDNFKIYNAATGALAIEIPIAGTDINIKTGNLIQGTAAKGVNFTANTPAAGMTSQLLNWYEEGTCTLTLTTDGTPPTVAQTATARYTRIGRTVTLQCNFANKDTTGATGYVAITGSPFTAGLSTQGVCTFTNLGATPAVVQIGGGGTTLNMYGIATQTAILMSAGTGRYLYFNITYTI